MRAIASPPAWKGPTRVVRHGPGRANLSDQAEATTGLVLWESGPGTWHSTGNPRPAICQALSARASCMTSVDNGVGCLPHRGQ
jgi:hypothetical protein